MMLSVILSCQNRAYLNATRCISVMLNMSVFKSKLNWNDENCDNFRDAITSLKLRSERGLMICTLHISSISMLV